MIVEYHRPDSIKTAAELLSRKNPLTLPLGGGTTINRPGMEASIAVVDLQALGLNRIERTGNTIQIGATVTLQQLYEAEGIPAALKTAIHQEASYNLRLMGTIAGTLVSADGHSPVAAMLLAMDARLTWTPGDKEVSLGEWLPLREQKQPGLLITQISIPAQIKTAYHSVARSADDFPIVCAAMGRWASGRRRLVLGGIGKAPVVVLDGSGAGGEEAAARDAYGQLEDKWASAQYRQEMAGVLAKRCAVEVEA